MADTIVPESSTNADQPKVVDSPNHKHADSVQNCFPTDFSFKAEDRHSIVNDGFEQRPELGRFRWFFVCVGIFSANVLYGLDTTIAADIQASVSETYDNVNQLGWLGVGFTLGSTVAILPLGKAYGIFDTKWLFIGCLTMFAAGSALCAAAPSMNAIIVGRVWAGAGGAGMYLGYDIGEHGLKYQKLTVKIAT
jgi:Major Facilitator Superfamily